MRTFFKITTLLSILLFSACSSTTDDNDSVFNARISISVTETKSRCYTVLAKVNIFKNTDNTEIYVRGSNGSVVNINHTEMTIGSWENTTTYEIDGTGDYWSTIDLGLYKFTDGELTQIDSIITIVSSDRSKNVMLAEKDISY